MSTHLMKTALGQALREARRKGGGTQSSVARELELDKGTVSEWERGQGGYPNDDVLAVYARLGGCSIVALWERAVAILADEATQLGPGTSE